VLATLCSAWCFDWAYDDLELSAAVTLKPKIIMIMILDRHG